MSVAFLFEYIEPALAFLKLIKRKTALLIIDDNADDRELLAHFITMSGYQFESVPTAEAGIALLQDHKHSIAFIDLGLPYSSGMDLVRKMKNISPDTLPVIVSGSHEGICAMPRGVYAGLILKPVTLESVGDCIKRAK